MPDLVPQYITVTFTSFHLKGQPSEVKDFCLGIKEWKSSVKSPFADLQLVILVVVSGSFGHLIALSLRHYILMLQGPA